MKAIDLIKSISVSDITSDDVKVVTAWRLQTEDQFIKCNFKFRHGVKVGISGNPIPTGVDSLTYLCVLSSCDKLLTPDGTSVLYPDLKIFKYKMPGTIAGETIISLYRID